MIILSAQYEDVNIKIVDSGNLNFCCLAKDDYRLSEAMVGCYGQKMDEKLFNVHFAIKGN